MGVAYRVESVLGSSEPQTLDSPGQVPAEIERFDRAVEESAAELESLVAAGGPGARAARRPRSSRATSRSSTIRRCSPRSTR